MKKTLICTIVAMVAAVQPVYSTLEVMKKKLLAGLLMLSLVLGLFPIAAKASLVTYVDDEVGFQAAVALSGATMTVESFEGVTPVSGIPSLDMGEFLVDPINGVLDVADFTLPGTDGTRWLRVYTTAFPTLFVFDDPVNVFAVDIANLFTYSGGSLSFQLDGGPTNTIVNQAGSGGRDVFFGVIDTTSSFSTIAISENIVSDENIVFDRVQFGIPEPATVCLLGLGGLVVRRRKRRS